jgi:hypothetical protein
MTIIEFLEARIAQDEAAAKVAIEWVANGPRPLYAWYGESNRKTFGGAYDLVTSQSPARVLAECAAKREIIPHLQDFTALEALAYVYKDHPDYDKNWRR